LETEKPMKAKLLTLTLLASFALGLAGCASDNPEGQAAPPVASDNPQVEKDAKSGHGMSGPSATASE
jgi:hypothetical protein